MFRKILITSILTLVLLFSFAIVCIATPSIVVNGKQLASKPNAKGLVSAKACFTALGYKVAVDNKGVMKVTQGNKMLVLDGKKVLLNKKPVKVVTNKIKGDYMVPTVLITKVAGIAASYDAKTMVVTIGKKPLPPASVQSNPPVKPEPKPETKPEEPKPAEPAAPAGLTGDKAAAYNMLIKCKYSGKATSSWDATVTNVIIIGSANPKVKTKSTNMATLVTTADVPLLAGGNITDKDCSKVPFIEIVNGKDSDIIEFLKKAENVTVVGDTITVTKSQPPDSIVLLLNLISSKVSFRASDLDVTCKIKVGPASVLSIDEILMKGTAHGTNDMPSTINGNVSY